MASINSLDGVDIFSTIVGALVNVGTGLAQADTAQANSVSDVAMLQSNAYSNSQSGILSAFEKSQNIQTIALELGIVVVMGVGVWLLVKKKKKRK
jgi:hypothetical protein